MIKTTDLQRYYIINAYHLYSQTNIHPYNHLEHSHLIYEILIFLEMIIIAWSYSQLGFLHVTSLDLAFLAIDVLGTFIIITILQVAPHIVYKITLKLFCVMKHVRFCRTIWHPRCEPCNTHADTHAHTHARTHAATPARRTHARTHARTHTHTHTHTHTVT